MKNRRDFIKYVTSAAIAATIPSALFSQETNSKKVIWANLLNIFYNKRDYWLPEYRDPGFISSDCQETHNWARHYWQTLTFDELLWNTLLKNMASAGMNMVVICIGDAIRYESHPEISIKDAWSHDKLKSELAKCREMGLEPIPKLNFSATHDLWLGEYSRMVSTNKYYDVCRDIIDEVCYLFDYPRFFHLGMDEETANHQKRHNHVVLRQNDLWWGDFYFYVGELEKNGVRPWVWSDYGWHHPEIFFKKMPKSVLQSNWYYGARFDWEKERQDDSKIGWATYVKWYDELEKHGYDQIPTGSNHSNDINFEATVDYCKKVIDPTRLTGFMTAPWRVVLPPCADQHKEAIAQVGRAIKKF